MNEEITYEYLLNEIQINNQQNQLRKYKKDQIIQILPYENTYAQFYFPDRFIPIEESMIGKIVNGVQAMATALTNTVNQKTFSISFYTISHLERC
jgi:uncharacterized protein YijF (DUF1287 family)